MLTRDVRTNDPGMSARNPGRKPCLWVLSSFLGRSPKLRTPSPERDFARLNIAAARIVLSPSAEGNIMRDHEHVLGRPLAAQLPFMGEMVRDHDRAPPPRMRPSTSIHLVCKASSWLQDGDGLRGPSSFPTCLRTKNFKAPSGFYMSLEGGVRNPEMVATKAELQRPYYGPYPQYGWDFPEEIPERPRKRSQGFSRNSLREHGWDPPKPIFQGI